jgi:hypothetical protein
MMDYLFVIMKKIKLDEMNYYLTLNNNAVYQRLKITYEKTKPTPLLFAVMQYSDRSSMDD